MKWMRAAFFLMAYVIGTYRQCKAQDAELYQLVEQSKEQIKWDCARLIYVLVQNAIFKVIDRPVYTTLYNEVRWVFETVPMQEVLEITHLLASKADMYAMAASIARQNDDEDAVLVLQIASENARKGWFAKHATMLTYTFGVLCGYVGAYYMPFNKDILSHLKIG